jgi:aryl-alcohol dehydrogenase-like predicted oxidoreductase
LNSQIVKTHEWSPARLSLAWLLANPVVTSVIVSAKRLDLRQDTLAAVELTLTPEELGHLDEVNPLPREYPGWALPFQGADRLELVDRWVRFSEARKQY